MAVFPAVSIAFSPCNLLIVSLRAWIWLMYCIYALDQSDSVCNKMLTILLLS